MITLSTPIVVTTTATTVQITGFVNNIEQGNCEIQYMIMLEDGTPSKRDRVPISGYEAVKALYSETDAIIATGLTFEEASAKILYEKVLAKINS